LLQFVFLFFGIFLQGISKIASYEAITQFLRRKKMKEKTNSKAGNTDANATAKKELANLTREQLSARYKENIAERKRLSGENKLLVQLWKEASPAKRTAKQTEVKPVAKATAKKK
jgi:DNA primase